MRFLHLSDLHLGLKLYNRDLLEDQEYVLEGFLRAAGPLKPDAVVIAGDVYDKAVPSAEAVELFDRFIAELNRRLPGTEVMLISGNHDSAPRLDLYREILSRQRVHVIGQPPRAAEERIARVTLTDEFGPVNFWLLPFVKPSTVKELTGVRPDGSLLSYDEALRRLFEREPIDPAERNVLVSHQFYIPVGSDPEDAPRTEIEILTVGNVDSVRADVLSRFDYAALGHIHGPWALDETHRYCGSPMEYSVSEAGQEKAALCVDLGAKGDVTVTPLPLVPLRRVLTLSGTPEEVLEQACADYVSVTLTGNTDWDVFDLQDRLHAAFPYLLEIRRQRKNGGTEEPSSPGEETQSDPFLFCCEFLKLTDEAELALLRDVFDTVRGEN